MKPNHTTARVRASLLAPGVAALMLLAVLSSAQAGAQTPQLIITGGPGIPGGTATATLSLSGDTANLASTADVDINFPNNLLSFPPPPEPITQNCTIASRLSTTHEVAGHLNSAGDTLILSIIVQGTPVQIPHLGNGPLATCNFGVLPGVPTGTAALTLQNAALFDNMGNPLDVTAVNGGIVISEATPTPTVTPTHLMTPTATPTTPTGGGTPSATPTKTGGASATPTITGGASATPTKTGGASATPTITGGASATPTKTGGATATPTKTGGTPGTGTPTVTKGTPAATATSTSGPIHFKDSDSCNIVPIADSSARGTLALLLAPAVLLWARRRRF